MNHSFHEKILHEKISREFQLNFMNLDLSCERGESLLCVAVDVDTRLQSFLLLFPRLIFGHKSRFVDEFLDGQNGENRRVDFFTVSGNWAQA